MRLYLQSCQPQTDGFHGGLAQLARALAWHARGHQFDPDTLHKNPELKRSGFSMLA